MSGFSRSLWILVWKYGKMFKSDPNLGLFRKFIRWSSIDRLTIGSILVFAPKGILPVVKIGKKQSKTTLVWGYLHRGVNWPRSLFPRISSDFRVWNFRPSTILWIKTVNTIRSELSLCKRSYILSLTSSELFENITSHPLFAVWRN